METKTNMFLFEVERCGNVLYFIKRPEKHLKSRQASTNRSGPVFEATTKSRDDELMMINFGKEDNGNDILIISFAVLPPSSVMVFLDPTRKSTTFGWHHTVFNLEEKTHFLVEPPF